MPGDTIAAYLPGRGYVGVGVVLNGARLDANRADYTVPVRWLRAVDRSEAKWTPRSGLYACPQVKAPISDQAATLSFPARCVRDGYHSLNERPGDTRQPMALQSADNNGRKGSVVEKRSVACAGILSLNLAAGVLPAAAAEVACNRDCLAGFMTTYLNALVKHDAASLPTTRNVKYTENGVRLTLGDGLWQTAAALPTYRVDVIDEESGQVGLLGRINENGNNNWYAVRLKVEMGKQISEIETLVNRSISAAPAPPGGAAPRGPTDPHPLMMQPHPGKQARSRARSWRRPATPISRAWTPRRAAATSPSRRNASGARMAASWQTIRTLPPTRCSGWAARPSSTPAFR